MMPQLPVMKNQNEPSSAESESRSDSVTSSFAEDSGDNSPESDVNYDEFQKPVLQSPDMNIKTQVNVPLTPKRGIEVVAQRKGFYNQQRYKEGDKFLIKSEKEFGEWMKCIDPSFEKKRVEFLKAKKAK
jgi:hypothetical protein